MVSERKNLILKILDKNGYVKGSALAGQLSVTRQVIVKDIAILRAEGKDIIATPNGYFLNKGKEENNIKKVFALKHDKKDIGRELEIIIDNGGKILDVIVEHPLYGEIKANLMLETKKDLDNFMKRMERDSTKPLSSLTDGIHLHTVTGKSLSDLAIIEEKLLEEGFIVK